MSRPRLFLIAFLVSARLLCAPTVGAQTCFEPGEAVLHATEATWIDEWLATTNNNGDTQLQVSEDEFTFERRTLLKFDLSAVPVDALIDNGELELWLESYTESAFDWAIDVYTNTSSWSEATVTWNTGPSSIFLHGPVDVDETPGQYVSSGQLAAAVNAWVNHGLANHGVGLRSGSSAGLFSGARFSYEDGANPPRLTVNYCGVPDRVTVPYSTAAIVLDGECNEYTDALHLFFNNSLQLLGSVALQQDETHLNLCATAHAAQLISRMAAAFDTDLGKEGIAQSEDLLFEVDITNSSQAYIGTNNPATPWAATSLAGWSAFGDQTAGVPTDDVSEFRIPKALLGADLVGFAFHHKNSLLADDYHGFPRKENPDQPATWVELDFAIFRDGFESGGTGEWSASLP